ncbi:MAG: ABC transporter ATP-binding protein [Anaerolineae bacterium]
MMHGRALTHPAEKARNIGQTLRRLLTYLAPHWVALSLAGLMVLLNALAQLAAPYLTGLAVDRFIANGDQQGFNRIMLILLGTYVVGWLTHAAQFLLTINVGQDVLYAMRDRIFEHFQALSLRFFDEREAGDLMSRLTNDTDAINRTLNAGLAQFVGNFVLLAGILVALLVINWRLALISMTVLPLMFLSTFYFSKRARVAARRSREQLGKVSAELEENISGVRVVQAFGREQETYREFRSVNAASRDANVESETVTAAFRPTLDIFSNLGIALVLGAGGLMAINDALTVGTIVAFLGYVRRFFQPVRSIGLLYTQVQTAIAAAERIFALLDRRPEITDAPHAVELPRLAGHILFDRVTFGYKDEEPVLCDISFEVKPGETLAIVGPTGAGKTTMVNLLMRFYDVDAGRILVDGRDVRDVTVDSLRRQMGMVLQDTYLFADTVMNNIRYGRLDASDEDVVAAAQVAGADDFIRQLPDGYETHLNERGARLSQGQRQLLAIARAVLADPRILILDEATSSIDTRTEQLIQAALKRLMKGRTTVVIAHRLSTIRDADQVLVVHRGRIIERGTHETLLAKRGFYHALYTSQFRDAVT